MDQEELVRRIAVYLQLDMPHLNDSRAIAEALGSRLIQYVRPEPSPAADRCATLKALVPKNTLLFFFGVWNGNSQRFRPVVEEVARKLGRRVIEVDVDGPIGGAIRSCLLRSQHAGRRYGTSGRGAVIIGKRDPAELERLLTK